MATEMGVLANMQAAEALYGNEESTVCWDATTLAGKHINEVHVSTKPNEQLTLDISGLAGGRCEDYVDHITSTITDAAQTYSKFHKIDEIEIENKLTQNLTHTLSDRAAVNHCVNQSLGEKLGHELTDLKCNVHPLDGLAHKADSVLKKYESNSEVIAKCFGQSSAAINLIYGVSKLKYDCKSGSPSSLKRYFQMHQIALSSIIRYVGNRFHVLFHMAGTVCHLLEHLKNYLKQRCPNKNNLTLAVLHDLSSTKLVKELIVLGFFGKYITGPWMALLYGGDHISNLEAIPLLKTCFASVVQIFNYPNQLFNASLNAFGDEMPKDDCTFDSLHILYMSSDTDLIHSLAKQLAEDFTQVLEKQLQAYISGDILQKVPSALSAPVHNMYAERVLGMVDAQRHRGPNASMQFLDSKVKYTLNGTEEWLNTQENDIITYARKHARKAKCARKAKEESVNFEQECRLKAVHQRHDTKERSLK